MTEKQSESTKPVEELENVLKKAKSSFEVAKGTFVQEMYVACVQVDEVPHFFLDGLVRPPTDEVLLVSRLIMSPVTFKQLRNVMNKVLEDYEKENGEIKIREMSVERIHKEDT